MPQPGISHATSAPARHAIHLLQREAVPHIGAELRVVVEEQIDEAVGVDQDQVGVVAFSVVRVFTDPGSQGFLHHCLGLYEHGRGPCEAPDTKVVLINEQTLPDYMMNSASASRR
ncbi:MAG: hypothetical protein AAF328_01030 [Planctomycetota bacterium]